MSEPRFGRDAFRALRDDLADALEGLRDMAPYVPEYFVEKWDLDDYVTNAEAALVLADERLKK